MNKHTFKAEPRTKVGRKSKQLRKIGTLPGTIYGKGVKSMSIQVDAKSFLLLYGKVGETGLVELSVGSDICPVLVHHVQKHPVSGSILHIEFHQVDLKQKVTAKVPVELTGEAQAVTDKVGVLLTILDEVEVEALPTDLPEKIVLDVSGFSKVNQELKVKDLKAPTGVTILSDAEQTLVKIGSLVTREAEAEAAAEAAAKAAQAAAVEAPAEGATEGKANEDQSSQAVKKEPASESPKPPQEK